MKKIVFLLVVMALVLSKINAQTNVVKVDPVGFLLGSGQFSYERVLDEKSAFEISLSYTNLDVRLQNNVVTDAGGFGAEAKYKKYFSRFKDAPQGWYGAPVLSYANISGDSGVSDGDATILSGGIIFGHQLFLAKNNLTGFALDFSLGLQYIYANPNGDIESLTTDGIRPRFGIAIGYVW